MTKEKAIEQAKAKGAEIGAYVAGKTNPEVTIHRCAIGFVAGLPFNDFAVEDEIIAAYKSSAFVASSKLAAAL